MNIKDIYRIPPQKLISRILHYYIIRHINNGVVRSCGTARNFFHISQLLFSRYIIQFDTEIFYIEICTFCDLQTSDPICIFKTVVKRHVYFIFRLYNHIQLNIYSAKASGVTVIRSVWVQEQFSVRSLSHSIVRVRGCHTGKIFKVLYVIWGILT